MFNPVTIIQSIFRWFFDTIGHLTSFSKLKFFLVTLFLLVIGWYYIQCYEAPTYKAGYDMHFYAVEPIDTPNVSLQLSFGHNSLKGQITSAKVCIDSFTVRSVGQQEGRIESNLRFPQRQPYLFKQWFLSARHHSEDEKDTEWHRDMEYSKNYIVTEQISVHDYLYSKSLKPDTTYTIRRDTLEYPIVCKPQWRCKGDLSTFIFRYEPNTLSEDTAKIRSIICDFNDYTQVVTMTPMPDSIWSTGFAFTDPQTLEYVRLHGIDGYGKFPQMEAWQLVRTFALTTLLATLLSLFFGLLYNFIKSHPLLISFCILSIACIIVCALIFIVSYLEYASLIESPDNRHWPTIALYIIILIITGIVSAQFIYKICVKYSVNFWAILFSFVVWFVCAQAAMRFAELSLWMYFVFGMTSMFSIFVSIYLYIKNNYSYGKKKQRFVRLYERSYEDAQDMISACRKLVFRSSISVYLAMVIGIITLNFTEISAINNFWICNGIIFITGIPYVFLYARRLKRSKVIKLQKEGKDILKVSIILQPFIVKSIGILLLFLLVLWLCGLHHTTVFICMAALILLPMVLYPYVYDSDLAARYERCMHDKIVKVQQKIKRRLYRL